MSLSNKIICTDFPLVSVVITTKNEEKNIRNCLESVRLQTWKNIETIVVDNKSTDRTKEIAFEYTAHVYDKGPERSAQRNYGMIVKAKGEYVIYIDADMILSPALIEACVLHVKATGAVALHISETVLGVNYFSRVRRFERSFYDGTAIDGARFFNRSAFVRVGGFDEALFAKGSGEDWDIDKLVKQIGSIDLLPATSENLVSRSWEMKDFIENRGVVVNQFFAGIFHNETDFDLFKYINKKKYYSQGFDGYIKKWGRSDEDIRKQFGIKYRYWTVFTENGKWKRIISRLDLAVGMYFLRSLVGIVYLLRKKRCEIEK